MGTRNLTMVICNGQTKIAQYGQWDCYPSGQGNTALQFLKSVNLQDFKKRLEKVHFVTEEETKEKEAFLKSIGSNDGWVNFEQGKIYQQKYKFDSRDHAAGILQLLMDNPNIDVALNDSSSFAADSLFCEWAYVIDLDAETFEVYKGFNQQPLTEKDRFFYLQDKNAEYMPVKLVKSYSLNDLPDTETMENECTPSEEE